MRRGILLAACIASLGACASGRSAPPPTKFEATTITIPVAVPCAAKIPAYDGPDTAAAIEAAPDIFERAKLYAEGRQRRIEWMARAWAAISQCSAAPIEVIGGAIR